MRGITTRRCGVSILRCTDGAREGNIGRERERTERERARQTEETERERAGERSREVHIER